MTDKNIESLLEAFDNCWATMSYDGENVVLVRAEMLKLVTNLMSDAKKKNALIKKLTNAFNNLKRKICKGNFESCKNKGKLGLCKFCALVAKAQKVI